MNSNTLERLINDRLFAEIENQLILISSCENVEYTKVWYDIDPEYDRGKNSAFIYFIKDENENYIGAVQKMEDDGDLFVLIKNEYRRTGIAYSTLSDYILPHICSATTNNIRCLFDSEESKALGNKLGFDIKGNYGILDRNSVKPCPTFIEYRPEGIRPLFNLLGSDIKEIKCRVEIVKDYMHYAERKDCECDLEKVMCLLDNVLLEN